MMLKRKPARTAFHIPEPWPPPRQRVRGKHTASCRFCQQTHSIARSTLGTAFSSSLDFFNLCSNGVVSMCFYHVILYSTMIKCVYIYIHNYISTILYNEQYIYIYIHIYIYTYIHIYIYLPISQRLFFTAKIGRCPRYLLPSPCRVAQRWALSRRFATAQFLWSPGGSKQIGKAIGFVHPIPITYQ